MNYKRIYDQIVTNARSRTPIGYSENHHIVPKCMGGSDAKSNLIRLTAREHYLCHWLLYKQYRTSALAHAWWKMMSVGPGQKRKFTSHAYAFAKAAHAAAVSERMRVHNPFKGKRHSSATKKAIGDKNRAHGSAIWNVRSDESKARYLEAVRRPKTSEHKEKIGRKGLVMLQNVNTLEIVRVVAGTLGPEWVNPRKLKPEAKHKCDHCDIVTTASMLKRWHNENCKRKPD